MNRTDLLAAESRRETRATIVEVVSEQDAYADLTAAFDFFGAFEGAFETHLIGIGENGSPMATHNYTHEVSGDRSTQHSNLSALFDRLRPDVVHTHRLDDLAVVGPAARAAGVPVLLHTVCGDLESADSRQVVPFREIVESLRPIVVAPSVESACRLNPAASVAVIPRGIDCTRYKPGSPTVARRKIGLPLEPRVIGCASPAGGLEILLQAMFRLEPDVHLALFGPALPGAGERGMIRRLGLEERVHVLGNWALPELIHQAIDVYFHGPSSDQSPRPILAAQACGKPVVAAYPAEAESLCPATGHLMPAAYQPALIGALRRALSNSPNSLTRGFVESSWDISASVARYEEILRSSIDGPRADQPRLNGTAR